ncbi:MAG: Uma2 family endonuclease [Tepidisphaerales bacterium]
MTLVDQILKSPRMPQYLRQINDAAESEKLRREEFYENIGDDRKEEFINGETIVHSPVRLSHDNVSGAIYGLLRAHVKRHASGYVGHEKLLICLTRNDYEPDICFFCKDKAAAFTDDQMKFPAPDFVVEVLSPSTQQTDRTTKFDDYAVHTVSEYWIVDADAQTIEQYLLKGEAYELALKVNDGRLRSKAVPGFEIPVRAAFDDAANLQALSEILAG